MNQWLRDALAENQNRKFHVVEGPVPEDFRLYIEEMGWWMPPSYCQFVIEFGEARFFRSFSYYLLEIFRAPHEWSIDGETVYQIARTDSSKAFFKPDLTDQGIEVPVYELFYNGGLQLTAPNFEAWLAMKWRSRIRYFRTKSRLKLEMAAVEPFSDLELQIVAARREYSWRKLGFTDQGKMRVQITNNSRLALPYLTLGWAGIREGQEGPAKPITTISVNVAEIAPGESAIVEIEGFNKGHIRGKAELFDEPDPDPEDRHLYREFRYDPDWQLRQGSWRSCLS